MSDHASTLRRLTPGTRAALGYAVLAIPSAALTAYLLFFSHSVARTEGERPIPLAAFAAGATVTHAFYMETDRLEAVSVRFVAAAPSSLPVLCTVFRLNDRRTGAEDDQNRYTKLYQWTTTLTLPGGDHWRRITFPAIDNSRLRWYRFEIRLLDAAPQGARIMASEDNPIRGGKLWIDGVRQPGSLFITADGPTPYEQFLLRVEPGLPKVLRNHAVQLVIVLVYLGAFVVLVHAMLFRPGAETDGNLSRRRPAADGDSAWWSATSLAQIVALTLALGLFFIVPDNFPDNPSNSLPFFPELVLLATLCLIAAGTRSVWLSGTLGRPLGRDEKLYCALLAVAFGYIAFRAVQAGLAYRLGFDPCAAVAPSAIVRLECRLDASFSQNYAWKSIAQSMLMLAIALVAAFVTRTVPGFWRRALAAIVLIGMTHATAGLVAIWLHTPQILPSWIMLNPWEVDRFTVFIPYPGLAWPHFAPALAIAVWLAIQGSRPRDRFLASIAVIVLTIAIAGTRQRGGLLLAGTMMLLAAAATVFKATRQVPRVPANVVSVWLSVGLWVPAVFPLLMIRSHTGGMFVDFHTRPDIWKAAVDGVIRMHPLVGFGYSRWAEIAGVAAGTPAAAVLETVHSLWIRALFEVGVIGLASIVASFLGAVAIAVRNAATLADGWFLVLCVATAFFICATFEEPDFVRPVIVLNAVLAGVCCGLPFRRSLVPSESLSIGAS